MDLKLLLQYPKAVQVLLAALQKSPASLPKLEKLLPPEIPAAALLSAMEQAGFLTKTGSRYVLQQETLEQMQQFLQLYAAVQNQQAEQDFTHFLAAQREAETQHAMLVTELAFFESVVSGNSDTVHLLYTPLGGKGYGELSRDPLRNLKYHLVITISMLTRYCIQGGMPQEEAFNLSDLYIQRTDTAVSEAQIHVLHYQAIQDFTGKMRRLQDNAAAVSAPHLSRLFQAEVHLSISEYIAIKKVEAAKNLLQYTEHTAASISSLLSFSSQSYFIKVFQKYVGMTPKEYRKQFHDSTHF